MTNPFNKQKSRWLLGAALLLIITCGSLTLPAQETSPGNESPKPNPVDSGARARYLSPEKIYAGSGLMVFGTVSDVATRLYDNGMVYTEVTLRLEETWKGSQPGDEVLIRQPGGTADGITTVSGPRLACRKGEQWLLGLALIQTLDRNWWTVYAVTQGSFRIEDGNAIRDYSGYNLPDSDTPAMVERREVIPLDNLRKRLGILQPLPQNQDEPKSGVINPAERPSSPVSPVERITPPIIQPGAVKPRIPSTTQGAARPVPFDTLLIVIGSGLFILVVVLLLRRRRLKHGGVTKILVLLILLGMGSISYGYLRLDWTPVPLGGTKWNLAAQTPVNFFQDGKVKYRLITAGAFAMPSAASRYAFINAFQTWEDSPNGAISFTRGSDITAPAYDQDFSIGFTDSSDNTQWGSSMAGFAGLTTWTYGGSYFTNVDISLSRTTGWSTDGSTYVDIEAVAVHEIGHAIGLHHSPHAQSVMSYVSAWDALLPDIGNEFVPTGGRRLASDDQIAVNVIYPVSAGTRGSIHGTITRGGTNVDAALIAVYDSLNRTVTTSYSRYGVYHIDGLLPGTYTLKFQPTFTTSDLNVVTDSLPWDLTPTVFAANASTDLSGVVVTAGNTTTANATVLAGTPAMRVTTAVRKYGGSTGSWACGLRIKRGAANSIIGLAGTGMPEIPSGLDSLTFDGGGITINSQYFDGSGGYPEDVPLGSGSTTIWLNVSVASNATLGMRALTLMTTGGERAIFPSFLEVYDEGTLAGAIGANNPPSGSIDAGETDYEMLQGAFTAGSFEQMRLRRWKIDNSGTGSLANVTAVKVYYDADADGTVGVNDVLLGSGVFAGSSATIDSVHTVPAGGSRSFLVTYDFTVSVVGGVTYLATLAELDVWGVDSARPVTPSGLPISGNVQVGIDRPPVLTSPGNKNVNENVLLNFTLSATDPDLDTIAYSMVGTPTGATLNSASGAFAWTPGYAQSGVYVVTFTARANLLSDSETITITVNNMDRPPALVSPGDKNVDEGQLLSFTLSATDPDGDTIAYSQVGTPTGSTFNGVSGAFSWTPYYTQSGVYVVTFTARANLLTDSKAITITVIEIDNPPVLISPGDKNLNETESLTFTLSASDPESDPISYSMAGTPTGSTFNGVSGEFAWTTNYNLAGAYVVIFTAEAQGLPDSKTITINVNNVDRPPVLVSPGDKNVNEGQLVSFTLSATDPDGTTIIYSMVGTPTGSTLNINSGAFAWTPNYTQSGSYPVTFVATAGGLQDSAGITITVNNVNGPPVLVSPGNKNVSEGQLLSFTLSATDPDLDTITYSMAGTPTGSAFDPVSGLFSWTPDYNQVGSYPVAFTATANGASDTKGITITVANTDRAPVLVSPGDKNVNENELLTFTLSATDPDLDTIAYSQAGTATGSTLNSSSGAFSWTPGYTQAGVYVVTFTARTNLLTDSKTITITVNNIDRPPVLTSPGNKNVSEGQLLLFTLSASDPDLETIVYSMVAPGATGSTLNSASGAFSWTPDYNQVGSYPVTFTATANGVSDTKGITITVSNTDRAPVLVSPGNKNVNENVLLNFTLSATDADGDTIAYSMTGTPTGSTLNSVSGAFSWTPGYTQSGAYVVILSAKAQGLTDSETITINVSNMDRPPVLVSPGDKNVDEGLLLSFTLSASDPDLETIVYSMVGTPTGSTLNSSSGAFSWTPNYTRSGVYVVTFTARTNLLTDSEAITITVNNIDRPPVLTLSDKNANEGQLLSFTLSASDPESDPISYSLVGTPTGSTFNPVSGLFSWTPDYYQAGDYVATFTASSTIFSDSRTITIMVNNVNGPPVLASPGDKNVDENTLLTFTLSATDPDEDTIGYSMVGTPTGSTLNSVSGEFSWTPNYTQSQDYMVIFKATANGVTDSKSVIITVGNVFSSGSSGTSPTSSGSSGGGGMCGLFGPEALLLIILMRLFRSVYRRQAKRGRPASP